MGRCDDHDLLSEFSKRKSIPDVKKEKLSVDLSEAEVSKQIALIS